MVVIFILMLGLALPSVSASGEKTIHYLALGDSLAAGITYDKKIGDGYSDMAAAHFKEQNALGSFSKAHAVPGYTTENVLEDLKKKESLIEAVKQANFITISAGANDILKKAVMDRESNTLILDPKAVPPILQNISKNYTDILQTIKEINPNASVYVMGYYFPYPYLSENQKPQLIQLTHSLNLTIQAITAEQGATFVPVYEKFGDDPKKFVPNPEDIHPNLDGYKLMTEALIEILNTPVASDLSESHWAYKELNYLLSQKLMNVDEIGNIYPDVEITRAEVAGILYSSIPLTKSIPVNPGFKDVPNNHPFYMAIAKLTEAGIFAPSEQFHPNGPITRAQLAKVITLAFQLESGKTLPSYSDISHNYWAALYIQAVTNNKIMNGYPNGEFGINMPVTRAQLAVVIVRASQVVNN